MTKKYIKRAKADVGFILTVYNLKRIINIIGKKAFRDYLTRVLVNFLCYIKAIKVFLIAFVEFKLRNMVSSFYFAKSFKKFNFKQNIYFNDSY